jgi:hypothetical protein
MVPPQKNFWVRACGHGDQSHATNYDKNRTGITWMVKLFVFRHAIDLQYQNTEPNTIKADSPFYPISP